MLVLDSHIILFEFLEPVVMVVVWIKITKDEEGVLSACLNDHSIHETCRFHLSITSTLISRVIQTVLYIVALSTRIPFYGHTYNPLEDVTRRLIKDCVFFAN